VTTDWYCFKCKEKMTKAELKLSYLGVEDVKVEGIICPKCGAKYIEEEIAIDKVAKGEKMIEKK